MEILLLLLVVGWLAYKVRGHSTNSNLESVRAYIFLDALRRDYSPQEANSVVRDRLTNAPAESARLAYDAIKNFHEGRNLNIVGYAYRRGLLSMMPRWYQRITSDMPTTPSLKSIYEAPMDTQVDDAEEVFSPASKSAPETSGIPKFTSDHVQWLYVLAAMSFAAILPLPYAYYMLLRPMMCIGAAIVAWSLYQSVKQANWQVWAFVAIAVLFNPLSPIHLSRAIWLPINLVAAVLFAWVASSNPFSHKNQRLPPD